MNTVISGKKGGGKDVATVRDVSTGKKKEERLSSDAKDGITSTEKAKLDSLQDTLLKVVPEGSEFLKLARDAGAFAFLLKHDDPLTIVVPNNGALAKYLASANQRESNSHILQRHVIMGEKVFSKDIRRLLKKVAGGGMNFQEVEYESLFPGYKMQFTWSDNGLHVNSAKVVKSDIPVGRHMVIHLADRVLPSLSEAGGILNNEEDTQLEEELEAVTLPPLSGEDEGLSLMEEEEEEEKRNYIESAEPSSSPNGVVVGFQSTQSSFVEFLDKVPEMSTLRRAIKAADLENALNSAGPFTVFAPTNAAFKTLSEEDLENLFKPENSKTLRQLITLHLAQGRLSADELKAEESIATFAGTTLSYADFVFGQTDIQTRNAIVHAVDSIILPGNHN
eukprot:TRINITY_DN23238_c0_g1_i6.p1 TRINITY_DN23238_c0_g1~~TRINITY_DN23238_c0_g1_i6.p1  ORF type:complete len:420 (-),score=61.83 TRINITY_DN23238_c0_g1_i6:194-1369(-)